MWEGQVVSNAPPSRWSGPVFQLSDAFPAKPVDEKSAQPWRRATFDAMFDSTTAPATKTKLAYEYIWEVMRYIQAGNISSGDVNTDWTLCDNPVRSWYHMPFQTYDAMSGREFVHGLTREAPVSFNVRDPKHPNASLTLATTMWAVGFYNPTAAYTLGTVWHRDGAVSVPTQGLNFEEGAVIGKLLFNTATAEQLPVLENMPTWTANVSDPSFCSCKASADGSKCSMREESQQCARSTSMWGPVRLLQFDIAVKDSRAKGTAWVFGTFVADGQRKAKEKNPWNRIAPLGLMWGNDTPPFGQHAASYPPNPRVNGFKEQVIFWDTVDTLNAFGGDVIAQRLGHLGCNSRLNGPADNANSSCMSCHMTASVPDQNLATPPIVAQFGGITSQCVTPTAGNPSHGMDASGAATQVIAGIRFAQSDHVYFGNVMAGQPFSLIVDTLDGPQNLMGPGVPTYEGGGTSWVPVDFSLQMSQALTQWGQWQQHQQQVSQQAARMFLSRLPAR
jgi:hypothetical protein